MSRSFQNFVTTCALVAALGTAGCFGQFALSHKIHAWNSRATNSPLANSLIMWGLFIIPVYELGFLGDLLIFNTIEVFTGDNPMAMNPDGSATWRHAGNDYRFTTTSSGAIEVKVNGRPSLRYVRQGEALEIETVGRAGVQVLPMGKAHALAGSAGRM